MRKYPWVRIPLSPPTMRRTYKLDRMRKYPRGRRGSPAKGVGWIKPARGFKSLLPRHVGAKFALLRCFLCLWKKERHPFRRSYRQGRAAPHDSPRRRWVSRLRGLFLCSDRTEPGRAAETRSGPDALRKKPGREPGSAGSRPLPPVSCWGKAAASWSCRGVRRGIPRRALQCARRWRGPASGSAQWSARWR